MRRQPSNRAGPVAALLLVSACGELPDLDFDQCGNGLIEPGAGEDCDSKVDEALGPALRCGAADGAAACRYTCVDDALCPTGWVCGADDVCRRPTSSFSVDLDRSLPLDATRMAVVDLDADGHEDVVLHPARRVRALYSDGRGRLEPEFEIDIGRALGRSSVLSAPSGAPALVVPLAAGVHLMRSTPARTLEGLAHAPFDLEAITEGRVRALTVSRAGIPQDDVLLLYGDRRGLALSSSFGPSARVELPGLSLDQVDDGLSIADIDGAPFPGRTDEILIGARGDDRIFIIEQRCPPPLEVCALDLVQITLRHELALPGPIEGGARLVDLDGDGRVDVFASVRHRDAERLVWIPQSPEGGFEAPRFDDRIAAACQGTCEQLWPLAVGDLDGDGPADFVITEGVLKTGTSSVGSGAPLLVGYAPGIGAVGPITDAVIGDFNRDGRNDVVVAGPQAEGVELLLSGPRVVFGAFFEATEGLPRGLTVGDFDGDLVDDLAVVLDDETGSRIAVLYGSTQGPLQPAIDMGHFAFVQQISAAQILGADIGPIDTRYDLLLQTTEQRSGEGAESSALLIGTAGRNMLAPYVLTLGVQTETPVAVSAAHFDGADPGRDLVALTSSATWVVASSESPTFTADSARRYGRTCGPEGWPECVQLTSGPSGGYAVALSPGYPCVPFASGEAAQLHVLKPRPVAGPMCTQFELPDDLRAPIATHWASLSPGAEAQLVVAFHGQAGPEPMQAEAAGLAILTFDEAGALTEALALATPPSAGAVWGVGAADLDDDVELELLLATDSGVRVADRRPEGWSLGPPLRLGLPDSEQIRAMEVTDLDDDGLQDLLLGTSDGLHIATGVEGRVARGSTL